MVRREEDLKGVEVWAERERIDRKGKVERSWELGRSGVGQMAKMFAVCLEEGVGEVVLGGVVGSDLEGSQGGKRASDERFEQETGIDASDGELFEARQVQ
jgi:hypothetical protein